ncbi:MAG: hypothetical protein QUS33_03595 [Dehalococcoidia bacterium]|nr:hypothetical protein [Dehalococcoidia bacterium]
MEIVSDCSSGSAIYLDDSDHINLCNSCFTDNGRWGVEEAGNSDHNIISSVQAYGDLGGICRCGASTRVHDSWSNDDWIAGSPSSSGLPVWAWALIGLAALVISASAGYLLAQRQSRFH